MRTIKECRSCWSDNLVEFLNLGEQYISDFREDISKPNKYPLVAVICEDCMLVQLKHTAPSSEMYHENYGFKSGISDSIKKDLKDIVSTALEYVENPKSWLDIASNDGYLLSCTPNSLKRVGVDPIEKYCKEAEEHADFILNEFFSADSFDSDEKFDVITAISCFYDMDSPNTFVSDVSKVLAKDGIWVIQQNYLLPTLDLKAVDNFCAEHLEYYTLLSLEPLLNRHGLEVVDLSTSMVNGGSIRTMVAHKGQHEIQPSVEKLRRIEREYKLDTLVPYQEFAKDVRKNLTNLKLLVSQINQDGGKVAILAASTRGATIWQSAGLTENDICYAVERNPEKVGRYFSAIGVPIVSEEQFRKDRPSHAIIGPWFFADGPDGIIARESEYTAQGGKLIRPLPKLEIV